MRFLLVDSYQKKGDSFKFGEQVIKFLKIENRPHEIIYYYESKLKLSDQEIVHRGITQREIEVKLSYLSQIMK